MMYNELGIDFLSDSEVLCTILKDWLRLLSARFRF